MSYLFPDKCGFCGKVVEPGKNVCKDCLSKLSVVSANACTRCGADVEYCNCKVGDFAYSRNISFFHYEGPALMAVIRMKYHSSPQLAGFMADFMVNQIRDKYNDFTFDFVTFVPSFRLKYAKRGYNTAGLLAEKIASALNLPLKTVLKKKFSLKAQKYQKKSMRRKNVRNKFEAICDLKGTRVLLIDDIVTTGSTMSECAKTMKKAGAKEVLCSTFAITLKK